MEKYLAGAMLFLAHVDLSKGNSLPTHRAGACVSEDGSVPSVGGGGKKRKLSTNWAEAS